MGRVHEGNYMSNGISLSLMMSLFPKCYQGATMLLLLISEFYILSSSLVRGWKIT